MNNADNHMPHTHDDASLHDVLPDDLRETARLVGNAGASARAASAPRLDRIAASSWQQAEPAPMPIVLSQRRHVWLTPVRIAAMLALGASVLAAVVATRSSTPSTDNTNIAHSNMPAEPSRVVDTMPMQLALASSDDLALFDTYLASADEATGSLGALTEQAAGLEDQVDAINGADVNLWLGDDTSGTGA
jgi:hypothetical protein